MKHIGLSVMMLAALAAPATMSAKDHDDHRYYDRRAKDYHEWNEREEKAYRRYLQDQRRQYREWHRVNRRDQENYWRWRHQHDDRVLWP